MPSKIFFSIIFAAALSFSGVVSADVITFKFTGTVNYGGNLASTGSRIVGSFSYDTKSKPVIDNKGYAAYRFAEPLVMSANVEGHTVSTKNLGVDVVNNFEGNVQDTVEIFSFPIKVDNDDYQDGYFGIMLASGADNKKVLSNTKLPLSYDPKQFDVSVAKYGQIRSDGSQNGLLLDFSVDSIVVIQVCHYPNNNSKLVKCKDY